MATQPFLPIADVVQINVALTATPPALPSFNQGLIVGNSAALRSGARVTQFAYSSWSASMLAAGFTSSSPEYIAMQLYFSQLQPPAFGWVGFQDPSAIVAVVPHSGSGGTGYAVGDVVTITQSANTTGKAKVITVASGVVTGLQPLGGLSSGTGYTNATGLTASGGSGTGLQVDITVGESVLIALEQCRLASNQWWGCMACSSVTADHEAVAAWAQTATPYTFYFGQTADAAVLNNTAGNLLSTLVAQLYTRVAIIYSTTQGGASAAVNNPYAAAAMLGLQCGLTTGLANSYFTMADKTLVGVAPEPLTQNQFNTIAGTPINGTFGNYGNVYVNLGGVFPILTPGITPSGWYIDEILNLDMLGTDCQFSLMEVITESNAVAQTDPGQVNFIHAVNGAAQRAVTRGYIAPGTWEGQTLTYPALTAGDPLPAGYLAASPPVSSLTNAQRQARQAPPIYLAINEANASQSVVCAIVVQR